MLRSTVKKYTSHAKHAPQPFDYVGGMAKKRLPPAQTLAQNLAKLLAAEKMSNRKLAEKSGVSDRFIGMILNGDSQATVDVAEALARPFGLTGWQLIMPDLDIVAARKGNLGKLIDRYQKADGDVRQMLDLLAKGPANDPVNPDPPPPTPKPPSRLDSVKSTVTSRAAKKGGRDANKK